MSNKIILIVGESGSGKDTLVNAVCKNTATLKLNHTLLDRNAKILRTSSHMYL